MLVDLSIKDFAKMVIASEPVYPQVVVLQHYQG